MKAYIVLYNRRVGRIGSVPLTDENRAALRAQFCLSLIQTDVSGTEHYEVIMPLKITVKAPGRRTKHG